MKNHRLSAVGAGLLAAYAATGCNQNNLTTLPDPGTNQEHTCFPVTGESTPHGTQAVRALARLEATGTTAIPSYTPTREAVRICLLSRSLGSVIEGRYESEVNGAEPLLDSDTRIAELDASNIGTSVTCSHDRGDPFATEYEAPYGFDASDAIEFDDFTNAAGSPLRFTCEIDDLENGSTIVNVIATGWQTLPNYDAMNSGSPDYEPRSSDYTAFIGDALLAGRFSGDEYPNGFDGYEGALVSDMDNNPTVGVVDPNNWSKGNPCLVFAAPDAHQTGDWSIPTVFLDENGDVMCINSPVAEENLEE